MWDTDVVVGAVVVNVRDGVQGRDRKGYILYQ